jgi:transposase
VPILGALAPGTPVAFEAAYGWGWLVELLEELELEPHLVHPSRCKAIAAARLKNDKVDAVTLAQLLRADLLPEAWIAPQQVRDLRALLRHRARLVRLATSLKNRVHAVLADRGIPQPSSLWTGPGRAWLAGLALPATPRAIIEDCCGLLDILATPIVRLDREIGALAKPDPRVQALMVLPSVGRLTAMTLVAEIGDISRFPTARKLCAWVGLTPVVRNSDRKVRHGHIGKQGSPWVRWILQEAAQTAKRSPCSPPPTPSSPAAGASKSPPWRSPAGCWPAASTSSTSWRPPPQKARPGALATTACACNTAVDLTEQPGPNSTVMRTHTGPEWVHASQLRRSFGPSRHPILRRSSPASRSFVR